jgi:hypothetical protein
MSTRVTTQLYSRAGQSGSSTRPSTTHQNDDRGEEHRPRPPPATALAEDDLST